MCLMQHVLREIELAKDHDGHPMFEDQAIQKITKMALDGWLDKLYPGRGEEKP